MSDLNYQTLLTCLGEYYMSVYYIHHVNMYVRILHTSLVNSSLFSRYERENSANHK